MFCTNCGNRIENYNKFCPNCGSQIINGEPQLHYQANVNVFSANNRLNINWMNGISIVLSVVCVLCSVLFPFVYVEKEGIFLFDEDLSNRYEDVKMLLTLVFVAILLISLVSVVLEIFNKNTVMFNFVSVGLMFPILLITSAFLLATNEKADDFAPGFGWLVCMLICISKLILSIVNNKKKN